MSVVDSAILIKLALDSKAVKKGLSDLEASLKKLEDTTNEATSGSSKGFESFGAIVNASGKKMTKVGSSMAKNFTAPIVAGFTVAINEARKFESSFAGVKKTVDATDLEFEILKDNLKEMSSYLPANINDINKVAEAAGQLGIKLKDIDEFAEVMINLGVATDLSAESAATQFARLQNIMGFSADEYEKLGSALVDLGNKSATTESEIMNFTMRLAPMARQAGLNTQEVMGISAAFTSMGLTAEAGGTAIGKFISSMGLATTKGVGDIQKLEKQFGMSGREMELMSVDNTKAFKKMATSVGMTDTELKQVIKAQKDLKNMSEISGVSMEKFAYTFKNDAAEALDMFFNGLRKSNDEGESAIGILSDMGITEVRLRNAILSGAAASDLFTESLGTANEAFRENNALQEEADKRYETLDSQLTLMKNNFTLVAIELGDKLLPYVKQFVEWLGKVANNIADMSPEKFDAIVKSLVVLAGIGPGLTLVGKFMTGLTKSQAGLTKVADKLKIVTGSLSKLKDSFNDGFKINPKGMGFGDLQLDHIGGRRNSAGQAIDEFGKFLPSTNKKMKESIGLLDRMKLGTKGLGIGVKDLTKSIASSPAFTGAAFAGLGAYMAVSIKESSAFRSGLQAIGDTASSIFDNVASLFGPIGDFFKSTIGGLDSVVSWLDLVVIGLGYLAISLDVVNSSLGYLAIALVGFKILTSLIGWLKDTTQALGDTDDAFNGFKDGVSKSTTALDAFSEEAVPKIRSAFEELESSLMYIDADMTKEEMDKIFKNTEEFYTKSQEAMDEAFKIERQQIDEYYRYMGEENSTSHLNALENMEKRRAGSEKIMDENQKKLVELTKISNGDMSKLNEKQKEEYLEAIRTMYEEADKILTPEEKRQLVRREELLWKKKSLTIKMTQEEIDELRELTEKAMEKEREAGRDHAAAILQSLEKDREAGLITEAQYLNKKEMLISNTYDKTLVMQQTTMDEMAEKAGMYNAKELLEIEAQMKELNILHAKGNNGTMTEQDRARRDELKALGVHSDKVKEKFNESTEFLLDSWGPEWSNAYRSASGNIDFDGLLKALADNRNLIVEAAKKLGKDTADGVKKGVDDNAKGPIGAMGKMAKKMAERFAAQAEIKSPSRLMMRMGGYITEGLADGISDEAFLVDEAVDELSDIISSKNYSADGGVDITRNIIENTTQKSESSLASAISDSVVKGLKGANIRAHITEDDLAEGVHETIRRDLAIG